MLMAFTLLLLIDFSFESTSDLLSCKCLECDDDSTVGKLYNNTCYYISVNDKIMYGDTPANTFKPNALTSRVSNTVVDGIVSQVTAELYNTFGYDVIYLDYTSSDFFTTMTVENSANRCLKLNIRNNTLYYDTNCNFELTILETKQFKHKTRRFYKCKATTGHTRTPKLISAVVMTGVECFNSIITKTYPFLDNLRCMDGCQFEIHWKRINISSKIKFTGVEVFNRTLPFKTLYAIDAPVSNSQYRAKVERDNYCYSNWWCYHQKTEPTEAIVYQEFSSVSTNSNPNDDQYSECSNSINGRKGMLNSQGDRCIFFASEHNECTIAKLDTVSDLKIFETFINNVSEETIIEQCPDNSTTTEWDNCMLNTYEYQFFFVYLSTSIVESNDRSYFAILGNKEGPYLGDVVKRRLIYKKNYSNGILEMKKMYRNTPINHICEESIIRTTMSSTVKTTTTVNPYHIDITKRNTIQPISKEPVYNGITTSRPLTVPLNRKENKERTNITIFIFTTCIIMVTIIVAISIHLVRFFQQL